MLSAVTDAGRLRRTFDAADDRRAAVLDGLG
jgi:hypothetical protein